MRNELCDAGISGDNEITVRHDITDPGYPSGLKVTQIFSIVNGVVNLKYINENFGPAALPVNSCEHCYFSAPQGYIRSKINGRDIASVMGDSVTGVVIDLSAENLIAIPGMPEIILKQKGFAKTALWVGKYNPDGTRDKNYICIEPVEMDPDKFGKPESMISPGSKRTAEFSLTVR
jgi:galactose mutarotase-like enzyme